MIKKAAIKRTGIIFSLFFGGILSFSDILHLTPFNHFFTLAVLIPKFMLSSKEINSHGDFYG